MLELYSNIKKYRIDSGMTQDELAKRTGYTDRSSIAKIEKGDVDLPQSKIILFAKALKVSPGELMGNTGIIKELSNISTPAAYPIPILGTICAGNGVLCEENFQGFFFIDRSIKADFCLNVHGDSMTGSQIFDGDKAFIRKTYDYVNGKIYAVRINDETEAVLKRVFWYADQIVLNSTNPDYEPIIVKPDDVSVIGEYVGVYHPAE